MKKPDGYTKEHKEYLDKLRDSGNTNMLVAHQYLEKQFHLYRDVAKDYFWYWAKALVDE